MTEYEILTFALKGVYADIDRLEQKIEKGRVALESIESQNQTTKPESKYYEKKEKVKKLIEEVKQLQEKSLELRWQIDTLEEK